MVANLFDFLIHSIGFAELYTQTASVWRNPAEMQALPMYVSQLLFSLAFVWIFTLHYENKGLAEGLRYGTYVGLLLAAPELGTYSYLPIPFILSISWMGAVFLKCLLCGVTASLVYKN